MTDTVNGPRSIGPTFISYRQSDGTDVAVALAWALRAAGVPVWHDITDLPPGDTTKRLAEAMDAGISGAVLVVTPEITDSTAVRETELPRLLELATDDDFTFAVASVVEKSPNKLDYKAPDRLLGLSDGILGKLSQRPVVTAEQRAELAEMICRRRIERLRDDVQANGAVLTLDVQTRVPPFAANHDSHLVLRLRPPAEAERRPNVHGLDDLELFLAQLPKLVAIAGATAVFVRGGAHLSVACALGATLPTTLLRGLTVIDPAGDQWSLAGRTPSVPVDPPLHRVSEDDDAVNPGPVLVYIDLLAQRSDSAYVELQASPPIEFGGAVHLRLRDDSDLHAENTTPIVAAINGEIRTLADRHGTNEVHLLLRCPCAIAVLLGRMLNTLTVHLYEWEDGPGPGAEGQPRYIPSLVLRSGAGGSPIHAVTAPRPVDA